VTTAATPPFQLTAENKYQLLIQISQKIRDTLDLDEILGHLLDTVHSVLPYDAAGIFVLNEDLSHPRGSQPRALIAGITRRGFDQSSEDNDRMLMHGEGITGQVIRSARPVIVPDVRLDSRYVVGRSTTLSEITVPLLRGERAIGALNIESDQLAAFDEGHLEILQFFADAAAISVEKATLHRRLVEQREMEAQIQTASAIQGRLLPSSAPQLEGYDIAGISLPAFAIGGDYYDCISLPDGSLGLVIADVSGNGVPAALVMSAFRALLRTQAAGAPDPGQHFTAINQLLPDFCGEHDFVTAVYAVLHPITGQLDYTNGGHPPLLLCHADGTVDSLRHVGPALNMEADCKYPTRSLCLDPGGMLAMFTDGVFDILAPDQRSFPWATLTDTLIAARGLPAAEVIAAVRLATRQFAASDFYEDDFTLVIVRRLA